MIGRAVRMAARRRRNAGGNGLLTGLVSYWKLDEASGDAIDEHGTNTLTDSSGIGSDTGVINTCRTFGGSDLFTMTSNSDVSIASTSVSYEFSLWLKLGTTSGTQQTITKRFVLTVGNGLEYMLRIDGGTPVVYWGDSGGFGSLSLGTSLSTGTWYFLTFGYDGSENKFFVSLNADAPVQSSPVTNQTVAETNDFRIGGTGAEYLIGSVDEVGFWKRTLSSTDRTNLYNSGSGLSYSSFT